MGFDLLRAWRSQERLQGSLPRGFPTPFSFSLGQESIREACVKSRVFSFRGFCEFRRHKSDCDDPNSRG